MIMIIIKVIIIMIKIYYKNYNFFLLIVLSCNILVR